MCSIGLLSVVLYHETGLDLACPGVVVLQLTVQIQEQEKAK